MKKISKIIILVASLIILISIIMFFVKKNDSNQIDKEIEWEIVKEADIEEPTDYIIKNYKEGKVTNEDIDFSYVYPDTLLVDKIDNNNISYYGKDFEVNNETTQATYDEFTENLKERCTSLYEKCSIKRATINKNTYVFLQKAVLNDIFQENLIILSNKKIINYYLMNSKLSDSDIDTIIKKFNYKSIKEDQYSYCDDNTCTLDFSDSVGYKLKINYDKTRYNILNSNVVNSSTLTLTKLIKSNNDSWAIVNCSIVYNGRVDAINDIVDIKRYEYLGEETINNKVFKHYSGFEAETKETSENLFDIYLNIVNPNLIVKIKITTPADNSKVNDVIQEFSNFEIIK